MESLEHFRLRFPSDPLTTSTLFLCIFVLAAVVLCSFFALLENRNGPTYKEGACWPARAILQVLVQSLVWFVVCLFF